MVAIARALVPDKAHAEDIVQESFIVAHRRWGRVADYESPRLWLRRVVINRCTSLRRRLGSEVKAMTKIAPREDIRTDLSLPTTEVWDEVRKLPRRQQQAIALHYVSGLGVAEIADTLECAEGTVKTHLHRARQQLKETLSSWEEA
jgi:RNA polymerase sigma-70 factor, ECF subfamily